MSSFTELADALVARVMLVGYPGAGKTGALACLVKAGFKLRIMDFDGNLDPLVRFVPKEFWPNIDVVQLVDKIRGGQKSHEIVGIPKAFADAFDLMDHWKHTTPGGTVVDLGNPRKDWGRDTIMLLDGLTMMGRAAFRRTCAMMNRNAFNTRRQDWGTAMADQEAFLEKLRSVHNRFHVICTAHLKMIGPKGEEKADSDLTIEIKEKAADIVPTRLYPSALGRELPPNIGGLFPTLLLVEADHKGSKAKRVIRTIPRPELDMKIPALGVPATLPIEDGLLTIFEKLTGGIKKCLTHSTTANTPTS